MKTAKAFLCLLSLTGVLFAATPRMIYQGTLTCDDAAKCQTPTVAVKDGTRHMRIMVRPLDATATKEPFVVLVRGHEDVDPANIEFILTESHAVKPPDESQQTRIMEIDMPPSSVTVHIFGTGKYSVRIWAQ